MGAGRAGVLVHLSLSLSLSLVCVCVSGVRRSSRSARSSQRRISRSSSPTSATTTWREKTKASTSSRPNIAKQETIISCCLCIWAGTTFRCGGCGVVRCGAVQRRGASFEIQRHDAPILALNMHFTVTYINHVFGPRTPQILQRCASGYG